MATGTPNLPYTEPDDLMNRETRLLIVDYDVLRYHSFDLFRYMLLDKEKFMKVRKEFIPMLRADKCPTIVDQVDFYRSSLTAGISPLDNFIGVENSSRAEMIIELNRMFADPNAIITPTSIGLQFQPVLESGKLRTWILRWKNDPYACPSVNTANSSNVTILEADDILDVELLIRTIKQYNINSVIIAPVATAAVVGARLVDEGYREPITFLLGTYGYNMEEREFNNITIRAIQYAQILYALTDQHQYEFGQFDPFSSITMTKRLLAESGDE